jgi:phosphohistidine phosphatase
MRHAKSDWSHQVSDFERPLNARGLLAAPLMAERLKKRQAIPEQITTSPANRALSTAKLVAEGLEFSEKKISIIDELYLAEAIQMVTIIQNIDRQVDSVLLVGHNPTITLTANYLTGDTLDNMPTASIYAIKFPLDDWQAVSMHSGTCWFFDYPRSPS